MADTPIRRLTPVDLPQCLALSTFAGWNQTASDWERMLQLEPDGCFAAVQGGEVRGTAVCVRFGPVAWIAMVIVHESLRGRGLGRRLVQAGLDYADAHGCRTVRLDATPLGEPIYRRAGFVPQFELTRRAGVPCRVPSRPASAICTIRPAMAGDLPAMLELDRIATGTDRSRLISSLCGEAPPLIALSPHGECCGFLARREGRLATQIGPCCGTREIGVALLEQALESPAGSPVYVDVATDNISMQSLATAFGLVPQRTLLRMNRGVEVLENPEQFQISSGPELG